MRLLTLSTLSLRACQQIQSYKENGNSYGSSFYLNADLQIQGKEAVFTAKYFT